MYMVLFWVYYNSLCQSIFSIVEFGGKTVLCPGIGFLLVELGQ